MIDGTGHILTQDELTFLRVDNSMKVLQVPEDIRKAVNSRVEYSANTTNATIVSFSPKTSTPRDSR